MNKQIPLIIIASFSISILLCQTFIVNPAYAVTFAVYTIGGTGSASPIEYRDCKYLSTSQVWCPTTTGIKIINPTTRTVTATIASSLSFDDIECDSTYCFAWDKVTASIGNLTMYSRTTFAEIDEYIFVLNAGGVHGHGIGLVTSSTTNGTTILVPTEGQACLDGIVQLGGTDEKGICFIGIIDGGSFPLDGTRFISDGATSDTDVNYDIIWNGRLATIGDPTANRAIVKHRDLAGNFQFYVINLADGDTTFATTQVCNTGNLAGGTTTQSKMFQFNGILYDPFANDIWT